MAIRKVSGSSVLMTAVASFGPFLIFISIIVGSPKLLAWPRARFFNISNFNASYTADAARFGPKAITSDQPASITILAGGHILNWYNREP